MKINEKSERIGNIEYLYNPTKSELQGLLNKSKDEVRGILMTDTDEVYVWNAYNYTHAQIDSMLCLNGPEIEFRIVNDKIQSNYPYGIFPNGYTDFIKKSRLMNYGFPINENINETLEKLNNGFVTKSPYDIVNLLKNKPKEYRILYDKNIDTYMIGDANNTTHWDMIQNAYKNAFYYDQEDFIEELGGTLDNYVDIGQSGFWDGDTEEENIEPYLWYIVFSPNEEWTLGTDGYNKRYKYPFGYILTRGCDLSEISLWDALGVPQDSEKLNESEETNLNDNFWKWFKGSKMINEKGEPIIFYHGTNKKFDKFENKYLGKRTGAAWSYLGHFFTCDESLATKFTKGSKWSNNNAKFPKNANVLPVYLNIKNPLKIPCGKIWSLADNIDEIKTIRNNAIKDGYDGIIIGNWSESFNFDYPWDNNELENEQIVAFYPNQIKSIDNKGTWSDSANIYEHLNKLLEEYL